MSDFQEEIETRLMDKIILMELTPNEERMVLKAGLLGAHIAIGVLQRKSLEEANANLAGIVDALTEGTANE